MRPSGKVCQLPAGPVFAVRHLTLVLVLLRAAALRNFFKRGILLMKLYAISKSKS